MTVVRVSCHQRAQVRASRVYRLSMMRVLPIGACAFTAASISDSIERSPSIAGNATQLVFYSSFMVGTQRKSTATMSV